jgi:spore coat polysaccharide biosynthesis protein SpsF
MTAAIIQARMGSTRLPGKVMRRAAGQTLLEHLVERLSFARSLDAIVVATSTSARDDVIERVCTSRGVTVARGSEVDVLDRYYVAARNIKADVVVRVTADCPLIDPTIVDEIVGVHSSDPDAYDLVTNRHPLTFPDGLDVDVIPLRALRTAWERADQIHQREHVIPYFWESGMRVRNVAQAENLFLSQRWTVDYPEDADLVAAVFEGLYEPGVPFGMYDVLAFLTAHPEIRALNAKYLPQSA